MLWFKNPQFPLVVSLTACCVLTSCSQAQNEPSVTTNTAANLLVTQAPDAPAIPAAQSAPGKTLHVKAGAAASGNGSAQKPFVSIQDAVDAAQGGDTIIVDSGTYEGGISIKTAFPDDAPLTIRAAQGAQPLISGMNPVTGWKAGANGIYTAEIEGRAKNLFVGAERLSFASWPKTDDAWLQVKGVDAATKSLKFAGGTPPEVTNDTRLYAFSKGQAVYEFRGFQNLAMNGEEGNLTFDDANFKKVQEGKYNRFTFFNSPSFITEAGEFAMEYLDGERTRFYFKPRSTEQLNSTHFRAGSTGISLSGAANVRIAGLAITGMNGSAIYTLNSKKIVVEDCVFYNNETGFGSRSLSDAVLRRCLIVQNYWGVGLFEANRVALEQCEVAFNDEDGIRVSGRVWDTKSGKLGAADLKFSQLYVHHHQYQGHPDNIQFFRGVGRVEMDRSLIMYGGQQLMMEQTEDMKMRDSVVLIGINRGMNLFSYGRPEATGWTLENNTIGFNRYNPVYFGGSNNSSTANLFLSYAQPVSFALAGTKADYDWFAPEAGKSKFAFEKPKKGQKTPSRPVVEANAGQGVPQLRNVPASMSVAFGSGGSSPTRLIFDGEASKYFALGDLIEVNGDGVARKVVTVEEKAITFAPALPASPFRYSNVLNWKDNTNFQIDTRPAPGSPVLNAGPNGDSVGASLDIAAYQKGDFDGDGTRDLPPVPQELAAMLKDRPNRYIYPYSF